MRSGAAGAGRDRGPGRRLGSPAPRPRRADLHRPARPHRDRAAGLQPRRGRGRARAGARAAGRGRPLRLGRGGAAIGGDGQPRSADRRGRGPRRRGARCSPTPRRPPFEIEGFSGEVGEDARLRHRYLDLRREPMQRALALRHRVTTVDAGLPRRRGLLRDRDPGPDPLDPRGRPRLPRAQPPPAGLLLRPAAVAPAVQAAADGRRVRALLPDRPLLPRRGPARRPPARLHPARPRDVVRRDRGRDRRSTSG